MRSFVIGFVFLMAFAFTVLSLRPGGLRRQLRFAARRLRIVLVLGGIYLVVSTIIRLVFAEGPIVDFGLPILAIILAAVFVVIGREPATSPNR